MSCVQRLLSDRLRNDIVSGGALNSTHSLTLVEWLGDLFDVAGPPARPSNVRLCPVSTQKALRVEWDSPILSTRVPADTYSVEVLMNDSPCWLYLDTVRPTSRCVCHYEADNLEPGTYMFRITPFNDVGSGPPAMSCPAEVNWHHLIASLSYTCSDIKAGSFIAAKLPGNLAPMNGHSRTGKLNLVYFGPQAAKNRTGVLTHPPATVQRNSVKKSIAFDKWRHWRTQRVAITPISATLSSLLLCFYLSSAL